MTSFIDTFYSCSNGDHWQLIIVSESGRYIVRHEPHRPSGGQASEVVGVDGPTASRATVGLSYRQQRTVLMQLKRLAMDISKHVFTLHGVDEYERSLVRRNLKRAEVGSFFAQLPSTEVEVVPENWFSRTLRGSCKNRTDVWIGRPRRLS